MKAGVNDVSIPANIPGVIAVGASTSNGGVWLNSSVGSSIDPYTGEERSFPNQKPEVRAPGVKMFSTASTEVQPSPYAYSTGTSDSTVIVVGALSIILEIHGEEMKGEDGVFDAGEMEQVKRALATSSLVSQEEDASHHNKRGYGVLDAVEWLNQVEFEFNIT
jgi:hypothetical protein